MTALMMDWPYDIDDVESPAFLVDREEISLLSDETAWTFHRSQH